MTTAPVHSLTLGAISRLAKSATAKPAIWVVMVLRMIMSVLTVDWLVRVKRNHRSRRELAALSPHLLADVGLSEEQRQAELRKPLWKYQAPGR